MTTTRSSRELADRVEVEFYRRRNRFRRWTWILSFVAAIVAGAWLVYAAGRGNQALYASGDISTPHRMFENDCAKCHEQWTLLTRLTSFDPHVSTAPDAKCLTCHEGPPHQTGQVPAHSEIGCAACHSEHRGDIELARLSNRYCIECHRDLKQHGSTGRFADRIERFDGPSQPAGHPEFAIHRLLSFEEEQDAKDAYLPDVLAWVAAADDNADEPAGYRDRGRIRFNHKVHLAARYAKAGELRDPEAFRDQSGELLDCRSCHQLDAAGAYMKPIVYESHCAECHPLLFDNRNFPKQSVPHEQATIVRGFLTEVYTLAALRVGDGDDQTERESSLGDETFPLPGLPYRRSLSETAARRVEDRVTAAEREVLEHEHTLFGREAKGGCRYCHDIDESADEKNWRIEPPQIPERWLVHSRFQHNSHRMLECGVCHRDFRDETGGLPVTQSQSTGDVLMPTVAQCLQCHGEEARPKTSTNDSTLLVGARSDCVECHTYHQPAETAFTRKLGPDLEPIEH